jgi:hypothetical protein
LGARFLLLCLGLAVWPVSAGAAAEVSCADVPLRECFGKVSLEVAIAEELAVRKVRVVVQPAAPEAMVRQILDAAGVTDYVIQLGQTGRTATVTRLGVDAVLPAGEAASTAPAAAGRPTDEEAVKAILERQKTLPPPDPDAPMELPGGIRMTARQLKAIEERGAVSALPPARQLVQPPGLETAVSGQEMLDRLERAEKVFAAPDTMVTLPGLDKPVSNQELKKMQEQADKVFREIRTVTLPDGQVVDLNELLAKQQQKATAASAQGGVKPAVPGP